MNDPLASQCTARSKATGQQCRRRVRGGGVCSVHGGRAPQVRAKREQRIALLEAARRGQRSPYEVLAEGAAIDDELCRRALTEIDADGITSDTLAKLIEALDRNARSARSLIDVGFQERAMRISERQGELLAGAVRKILDELNLSPAQQSLVGTVVPRVLRSIEGGAA